jgi:hypothetical protein
MLKLRNLNTPAPPKGAKQKRSESAYNLNCLAPSGGAGAIRDINPDVIKINDVIKIKLIVEYDMQDYEPFHCKPPFSAKVLSVCQMYSVIWLPF